MVAYFKQKLSKEIEAKFQMHKIAFMNFVSNQR